MRGESRPSNFSACRRPFLLPQYRLHLPAHRAEPQQAVAIARAAAPHSTALRAPLARRNSVPVPSSATSAGRRSEPPLQRANPNPARFRGSSPRLPSSHFSPWPPGAVSMPGQVVQSMVRRTRFHRPVSTTAVCPVLIDRREFVRPTSPASPRRTAPIGCTTR
jgi:hypothetical protein